MLTALLGISVVPITWAGMRIRSILYMKNMSEGQMGMFRNFEQIIEGLLPLGLIVLLGPAKT